MAIIIASGAEGDGDDEIKRELEATKKPSGNAPRSGIASNTSQETEAKRSRPEMVRGACNIGESVRAFCEYQDQFCEGGSMKCFPKNSMAPRTGQSDAPLSFPLGSGEQPGI